MIGGELESLAERLFLVRWLRAARKRIPAWRMEYSP